MWRPLIMGGVVGAGIAGYLLMRKTDEIERQGSAMAAGLAQLGARYAQTVAAQTGEQYMREVYGITPERIANAGRLATAMGLNIGGSQ